MKKLENLNDALFAQLSQEDSLRVTAGTGAITHTTTFFQGHSTPDTDLVTF